MLVENEQNQKILPSAVDYRVHTIISLQTSEFSKTKEFLKNTQNNKTLYCATNIEQSNYNGSKYAIKWK